MTQLASFYPSFAIIIMGFPILLTIGIFTIPHVRSYMAHEAVQDIVSQRSKRWFAGHLLSGIAYGYHIVVACCITIVTLANGNHLLWSSLSLPLMTIGVAIQIFGLGADGIGPVSVKPAKLFFDGSHRWIIRTFISGVIIFGLGQIILVAGMNQTGLLSVPIGVLILVTTILYSLAAAIPSSWGLYATAIAAWVIYLPIGITIWQNG